ncbi:CHAD domain-containing protein [Roseateles oligotrophus]|uniref:CHAD domain-containing protein n=1 Tax=Roseateles oligotrophus TaxID=1769250 RepID=A0ABT2YCN2_9BURK|nr:CHAD domain-containing protein [Roseateles oligotrophus]MCV2367800.1 CHAD domain-containing protein [Roseateles oligotrophus]
MPKSLEPSKATEIKFRAGITLEQGFVTIARNCLKQMRANEAGLRGSVDPEFVHQMRVGLRRLRSGLSLFKPWIALPPGLADEIEWLSQSLGKARDAEVLAATTLPALIAACPDESLNALQKAALTLARRRRRAAVLALNSARYRTLMGRLEQWLKAAAWRADCPCQEELDAELAPAAASMLRRRKKKMQACAMALQEQAGGDARHRLRIAVKKLRYATEFFRSIEAKKAIARLARLSDLQELLGQLNDAEVARTLLLDLGQAQASLLAPAAFARGVLWAQSQQQIAHLGPLLRGPVPDQERPALRAH